MTALHNEPLQPIAFIDFDDVIVLNQPGQFGGYDVIAPNPPPELWSQLFHRPATDALIEVLAKYDARIVVTTSWLRFMMRESFEKMFVMAGLEILIARFHNAWEAPQSRGETRAQAIDRWLAAHHRGEPYVVLDDELSGTGLRRSVHDRRSRVILCKEGIGLHRGHLKRIGVALSKQPTK